MTDKECIDIIQAKMEGKEVHWVPLSWGTWGTYYKVDNNHQWNFEKCNYRVKPKVLEFWRNVYIKQGIEVMGPDWDTKKEAKEQQYNMNYIRTSLFREVLDES